MNRRSAVLAGLVVLVAAVVLIAVAAGGGGSGGAGGGSAAEAGSRPDVARALARLRARAGRRGSASPIVMVVFDELPLTSLLGPREQIDAARYPAFADLARRSVWYRNATAVHDSTALAVPAILDGRYPRPGLGSDAASHPDNLFTLLSGRYDLHVSEEATGLCPPELCTPPTGDTLSRLGAGRVERFRRWVREIGPRPRRALHFKHVLLPHVPWRLLPSGTTYRRRPAEPIPGLNGPLGFGDPWLVRFSYGRHLLQLGFADRLLGELLAHLRRTQLMRRALVLVVADHGIGFHVGQERRTVTRSNVADIAPVPLFLKLPGQTRGVTVDEHVETIDVLPTLLDAARHAQPAGLDGRSLLRPGGAQADRLRIFHRIGTRLNTVGGSYSFPVSEVVDRRRAALERKLELFGSGGGRAPARMFAIGPHPELIGGEPAGRALGAAFDQAADLRAVRRSSGFVPAELTGTVRGGRTPGRAVALALNGRVVATGHTFRLAGSGSEQFALMVPETAFARGRNAARLYEIP